MDLPMAASYRTERRALVDTLNGLTPDEFDHGTTLCEGWAPRDVFAHLLGIDRALPTYFKALGNTRKANAQLVADVAELSREEMLSRAETWAATPARHALAAAPMLIGDLGIHHQDIVRGLCRTRDVPPVIAGAILREGLLLGGFLKLRSHRIAPVDGGRALGRGTRVSGTRESLGLWLSGRRGLENELTFG